MNIIFVNVFFHVALITENEEIAVVRYQLVFWIAMK